MTSKRRIASSLSAVLAAAAPAVAQTSASVAVIEIEGSPAEQPSGMSWLLEEDQTLLGLVETLDTVAYDNEFAGVVIKLRDAALATSQAEELSAAIRRVRDNGKKVHVFSETYGPSDMMLASASDGAIIQRGGMVSLPGMFMEEMYLADTLEWIGVDAQLIQVGDYKGANETMTRSGPSPAWDENISGLLDGLYSIQCSTLADGFGFDEGQLDDAYQAAWWADAEQAIDAGLLLDEVDLPDIREWLADAYGVETVDWVKDPYSVSGPGFDASNPFAVFTQIMSGSVSPRPTEPTIAVLHIEGTIIDGDSSSGGLFGGGVSTGSRTIRNAIETILREDLIEGVVVRVESPGGSAMASEVIWQGLERLSAEKPVWVSVGSMAASGGYYVLSAGQRVYVNPSSIVGSIGVVGGKYAMGDLYDKLKIKVVERARGPHASLMSSAGEWTAAEQDLIRTKMAETYSLFASRVQAGRPDVELSEVGEGRLFTGEQAVELHMADAVGGLDDAINDLSAELGLAPSDIMHYPTPPGIDQIIEQMLGGFVAAPSAVDPLAGTVAALRELLGEERFNAIADQLRALTLLRDERVLLVSPRALFIR